MDKTEIFLYILVILLSIIAFVLLVIALEESDNGEDICKQDCNKLSMNLFKYDNQGLGSPECWCNDNGEIKQVW